MKIRTALLSAAALCACIAASGAMAAPVNSTGLVTPGVFFGTGNGNGSFTGETQSNVEVALRGKIRGQGVYNYDGDHTYTFNPATYPGTATRSAYNFEWAINTNASGAGANTIGSFDYLLQIDNNPSVLTNFISGDPYAVPDPFYPDHSFGNNSTPADSGVEASSHTEYLSFLSLYNASQQSWNMGFGDLNGGPPYLSNPQQQGLYTIALSVLEKGTSNVVASTSIDIKYGAVAPVPLPAALPLLLGAVGALGGVSVMRRRRRAA